MAEPLNLSYAYSNQYKEEKSHSFITLASRSQNSAQRLGPVSKWPYKTLTERLIINDVLLMLKGCNNVCIL